MEKYELEKMIDDLAKTTISEQDEVAHEQLEEVAENDGRKAGLWRQVQKVPLSHRKQSQATLGAG